MSSVPVCRIVARRALESPPVDAECLKHAAEFFDKMKRLRFMLEADLLACDAKWTLFVAAALGYRYDLNLKPFPPAYVSEQHGVDIDSLIIVINDTPKLRVVLACIANETFTDIAIEVLELLYYVLVILHDPRLRMVDEDEFSTVIMEMIPDTAGYPPTHVFEVCKPLTTSCSGGFPMLSVDSAIKMAYHGNKLDRFYSIINSGFRINVEEENHILLTKSFTEALAHSPNGAGWGGSSCGSMISCVALCEYKEQPQLVDEVDSEVLVRDGNLVCPRYLLFYGSRFPDEEVSMRAGWWNWIKRHKYSVSLACYMVILASIGYANPGHIFSRRLVNLVNFYRRFFTAD